MASQTEIDFYSNIFTELKVFHRRKSAKEITNTNNSKMIIKLKRIYTEKSTDFDQRLWYYDIQTINELLQSYSVSTKKNYYSLIIQLIDHDISIGNFGDKNILDEYLKLLEACRDQKKYNEENSIISEKKKEQQVGIQYLETLIDNIKDDILSTIIIILLQYPIRAEVGTLRYITLKDFKKLKDYNDYNYLIVGSKKLQLFRSKYKTHEYFGNKLHEITGRAKKVLNQYMKDKDFSNNDLLFGFDTEQKLSQRLVYMTKKNGGISLSVNSIAKITIENNIQKILTQTDIDPITLHKQVLTYLKSIGDIRGTSLKVLEDNYINEKK